MGSTETTEAAEALRLWRAGSHGECASLLDELAKNEKNEKKCRRLLFDRAVVAYGRTEDVAAFGRDAFAAYGLRWPEVEPEQLDSPYALYGLAVPLYRAGRLARAARLLDKALTSLPSPAAPPDEELAVDAVLLAAEIALRRGAPRAARALLDSRAALFRRATPAAASLRAGLSARAALADGADAPEAASAEGADRLLLEARRRHVAGDPLGAIAALARRRPPRLPEEAWAPINNALAVLHSAIGRPNLAVEYAGRALLERRRRPEDSADMNGPVYSFNAGVALLRAGRPEEAFDRLVEAVRHRPNRANIWLRLAECCALADGARRTGPPTAVRVGEGPHAKLRVDGDPRPRRPDGERETHAIPTPTVEFAALCLTNARLLLPEDGRRPPADDAEPRERARLRRGALLLSSYASLRLDDPAGALESCSTLLAAPAPPRVRALAHLYAAEALVALDRPAEAIEHLNPTTVRGGPADEAIDVAVRLNAAVCGAARGNPANVRALLGSIDSPKTLPLRLYLETINGNTENCRALLRKFART